MNVLERLLWSVPVFTSDMAKVINHQHLFTTDLRFFKALQIIGGRSIFDRYNAARGIIGKVIDPKYQDFLAWPVVEDDKVEFHGIRSTEEPRLFSELSQEDRTKYQIIKDETVSHYKSKVKELSDAGKLDEARFIADAIKVVDDRFLYCYDGKVVLGAWGMQMKENVREDISEIRKSMIKRNKLVSEVESEPAPPVVPPPPPDIEPHSPVVPPVVDPEPVPVPAPKKRRRCKWSWKSIWKWLWWLLLLLLLLFLAWLASRFIPGCNPTVGGIYNPSNPYGTIPTPPGYDGILPPNQGVLPPSDDFLIVPGNPSIVANRLNILMENEDKSILDFAKAFKEVYQSDKYKIVYYDDVVKRLQIAIPSDERETLRAEIPSKFVPDYELYVFDETLFEGEFTPSDPGFSNTDYSWYFPVIKAYGGWDYSTGSKNVTVAVVDNGFNVNHIEFKSKVVKPYNVWTHSSEVYSQQIDHGTHIAGTAVALAENGQGLCGIAPACRLMPVQVADNRGVITITSVLDGILYSIYQGADVVNVSLGVSFAQADQLPLPVQQDLVDNHFKEEERLWREVMRIAAKRNCTIVVAAGNENILAGVDALHRPELFITVAATGKQNQILDRAEFSNFGEATTISAPGIDIVSTVGNDEYTMMSGTSMAAPIVSGAVALIKSIDSSITTKKIIQILKATGLPTSGDIGRLIQLDKALEMVKSGSFEEEEPPVPSTGDVQILLGWKNYNDLDLICTDPNGETIWFKNKRSSTRGQLEIDMNVEYPDSQEPIENIYWPSGGAPNGDYNVYVLFYKQHTSTKDTPYTVNVKHEGQTDTYSGIASEIGHAIHVCTFTVVNGVASNSDASALQPSAPSSSQPISSPDEERRAKLEKERDRLQRELDRVNNELNRINNNRR